MNNNQKKTFHIDIDALTDQAFTLLDAAQSDNKHEINELMNDFKMYSFWRDRTYQQSRQCECFEIKVNIDDINQGTTHTKELNTNK